MNDERSFLRTGLSILFASLLGSGCAPHTDDAAHESSLELAQRRSELRTYDIDPLATSASGLSSGAFMAVQFHVAFSASMKGVAAFAGGPFACAQGSVAKATGQCMSSSSKLDATPFVNATRSYAQRGAVDPVDGLANQNVFLFGGADDRTVAPAVMDSLADYYEAFVTSGRVVYERKRPATGHTMPTTSHGVNCADTASPYLGRCNYDGAGAALRAIYGALEPPATTLSGETLELRQGDFIANPRAHSLAETGYAYVPKSCSDGERCRIHVAFHGCVQAAEKVGSAFYALAGYNEWADTNHIVVLYPQTVSKSGNPNGCWDWWGYDGADYATRTGSQMATVKRMVDAFSGGGISVPVPPVVQTDAGTSPSEPPQGVTCFRSSNAAHVSKGRAHLGYGLVYANGSNQAMGLYAPFVFTSLAREGENFVLSTCR